MTEKRVKDYYTGYVRQEWRRLIQDAYHRLEYDTTFHFLEKYLPKKGRILDAGGGPGRYTLELAKRGYEVVLLDMTRANLEFARRQIKRGKVQDKVGQVIEGSIVDLSQFADNTFDAVVCLGGPLSHVLDQLDREMAIKELIRVAKQGAPIFVSVMGRLSILVVELALFPHELEKSFFKPMRDGGDYHGRSGFTACHFFLPEELMNVFQSQGLIVLEMVGLEGLGSHHDRKVNELAKNKKRWRIWMETHYKTCTHPSVVGISEHMLLIGKKRRIET
jgi:SAM-dependent methyltransferase